MAVEDHPRYDDWSAALDRLQQANELYRVAVKAGRFGQSLETVKAQLHEAQAEYNKISEEL